VSWWDHLLFDAVRRLWLLSFSSGEYWLSECQCLSLWFSLLRCSFDVFLENKEAIITSNCMIEDFVDVLLYSSVFCDIPTPALCGLRGCKNRPALFPGRMSYQATKPGCISLSLSTFFHCVVAYYGYFLCKSLCWYVFCLLVVLVKVSVLAKWLATKSPLRKPKHGEGMTPECPVQKVFIIFLV